MLKNDSIKDERTFEALYSAIKALASLNFRWFMWIVFEQTFVACCHIGYSCGVRMQGLRS